MLIYYEINIEWDFMDFGIFYCYFYPFCPKGKYLLVNLERSFPTVIVVALLERSSNLNKTFIEMSDTVCNPSFLQVVSWP